MAGLGRVKRLGGSVRGRFSAKTLRGQGTKKFPFNTVVILQTGDSKTPGLSRLAGQTGKVVGVEQSRSGRRNRLIVRLSPSREIVLGQGSIAKFDTKTKRIVR